MGIPGEVFHLYRLTATFCRHDLLTRVGRPGWSNADQGAEDAAYAFADAVSGALRDWYRDHELRRTCRRRHAVELVGEGAPDVEADVDAPDEDWALLLDDPGLREVEADLRIVGLGDGRRRVFLLTDRTGTLHLNHPGA